MTDWFEEDDTPNVQPQVDVDKITAEAAAAKEAELEQKYAQPLQTLNRLQEVFNPNQGMTPDQVQAQQQQQQLSDLFFRQQLEHDYQVVNAQFDREYPAMTNVKPLIMNEAVRFAEQQRMPLTLAYQQVAEHWGNQMSGQAQPQAATGYNQRQTVPGMLPFGTGQQTQPVKDVNSMSQKEFAQYKQQLHQQTG
jgi:hypothetical protein